MHILRVISPANRKRVRRLQLATIGEKIHLKNTASIFAHLRTNAKHAWTESGISSQMTCPLF